MKEPPFPGIIKKAEKRKEERVIPPEEAIAIAKLGGTEVPEWARKIFRVFEKIPEDLPDYMRLIGLGNRSCNKCDVIVSNKPVKGQCIISSDIESALKFVIAFAGYDFGDINTPFCFHWDDFLKAIGKDAILKKYEIKNSWKEVLEI